MSTDGPCSILRGGGMRGFTSGSIISDRDEAQQKQQQKQQQQQAVRFGVGVAYSSAPATSSSAAWDANDEPLPDILSGPTLRSVSSLVMSIDADETSASSPTLHTSNKCNDGGAGAATGAFVSAAVGSKMVDMLMAPLPQLYPSPTDASKHLMREQSYPPPFDRPRLAHDQSFPPPVQQAGDPTTMDILQSDHSLGGGWSGVPVHSSSISNSGGGSMMGSGIFGASGNPGGAPSSPQLRDLCFPSALQQQQQQRLQSNNKPRPLVGRGQSGGEPVPNTGGGGGFHQHDPIASSPSHPRHPSFDQLAEMIPSIPHWTNTSPTPSLPPQRSTGAPAIAGGLDECGGSRSSISVGEVKSPQGLTPAPTLSTLPAEGRRRQQQQQQCGARPEKGIKGQQLQGHPRRSADSSPPPRGRRPLSTTSTSPPPADPVAAAAAASASERAPSSGTGKRGVEPPLPCGPAREDDLAQRERRRLKMQRYLYKRSRRKFAKSTRDASPSRSRPKAARERPRVKGKFVKTVPEYISVNASKPQEVKYEKGVTTSRGGGGVGEGGRHGGLGGGDGGDSGGLRSVRHQGVRDVSTVDRKEVLSTAPAFSLFPRDMVFGGGTRSPPPVAGLAPPSVAPNTFPMSAGTMPVSMSM